VRDFPEAEPTTRRIRQRAPGAVKDLIDSAP
jgi:hypothetical protein